PIHEVVDESLEILGAQVAIVDVVAVLPHVASEDGLRTLHERVFAVRRLQDLELSALDGKPAPARPELRHTGLNEVRAHLVVAAIVLDESLDLARQLRATAALLHPVP